jgi:biopolymer transport protein ExbD
MKVISYTDEKYNIKRFEIFGYISNGKIITNETSLRLAHIRNRVLNMFGGSRNNIIYLNVSADIRYEEMETVLKDLEFIMAEIVAVLQQGA